MKHLAKGFILVLLVCFLWIGGGSKVDAADGGSGEKNIEAKVTRSSLEGELIELEYVNDDVVVAITEKHVYVSQDKGAHFESRNKYLCEGCIDKMVLSPAEKDIVAFLGTGEGWIVDNIKKTEKSAWRKINLPEKLETITNFQFHPTDSAKALLISQEADHYNLYQTRDRGKTWTLLSEHVKQASYGNPKAKNYRSGSILGIQILHSAVLGTDTYNFFRFEDGKMIIVIKGGKKLAFMGKFLYVATEKKTLRGQSQGRELHVSTDNGHGFLEVKLPFKSEKYTLLDASEGSVFLNVLHNPKDDEGGVSWGTVYQSDAEGARFTLTLPYNRREPRFHCDFHKIKSVEGIYIANVISNAEDQKCKSCGQISECQRLCKIQTMITFDKGGKWQKIPHTKSGCSGEDCHLHLHGLVSEERTPILSDKNAVGMIVATGNVGPHLDLKAEPTTFVSRDAGLTWAELSESRIYSMSDHGGLIATATSEPTNMLVFSWNEGKEWFTIDVTKDANKKIHIQSIRHSPDDLSKSFLLISEDGANTATHYVDFSGIHTRDCKNDKYRIGSKESDYEYWSPHSYTSSCLLGRKIAYIRKKQDRECFNPFGYDKVHKIDHCACTQEDYECDYGFVRDPTSEFKCIPQYGLMPDQHAPSPCRGRYNISRGYIKIAGDSCTGGVASRFDPELRKCPSNLGTVGAAVSIVFLFLLAIFAFVIIVNNTTLMQKFFKFLTGAGEGPDYSSVPTALDTLSSEESAEEFDEFQAADTEEQEEQVF